MAEHPGRMDERVRCRCGKFEGTRLQWGGHRTHWKSRNSPECMEDPYILGPGDEDPVPVDAVELEPDELDQEAEEGEDEEAAPRPLRGQSPPSARNGNGQAPPGVHRAPKIVSPAGPGEQMQPIVVPRTVEIEVTLFGFYEATVNAGQYYGSFDQWLNDTVRDHYELCARRGLVLADLDQLDIAPQAV